MIIQKNFHSKIINHLAELCSKHKVVPFIGSGCSEDHLHVNWDSISKDLSKELNVDYTNNLEISQLYVNHFGYLKLCDYLKKKLIINDFTDEQGSSYLALMSLGLKSIYTTNFDNVFENCLKKYNRDFTKIVDLKDLNNSLPGDNFYYKFHGDLEKPTSIIFTESDYEKRIKDKNNFLNIRLKSDLLAKNLLFIGYSFRDKDIQFLINELNKTFDNELPNSYMIIWEYSDEINNLCNKYNIQLINPMDEFLNVQDNAEAFNKFLTELCNQTFIYKSNQEL